jgi:hypothetical protein
MALAVGSTCQGARGVIRATVDPGSAWAGVFIFDDSDPAILCRFVAADAFPVGRKIPLDPPERGFYADRTAPDGTVIPGKPWIHHYRRECDETDEQAAGAAVFAFLRAHGVERVTIEKTGHMFLAKGDTVGALLGKGTNLQKTKGVATWIAAACIFGGMVVDYVQRATWAARIEHLLKLSRVAGEPVPLISDEGSILDPVLQTHVEDWPGALTWEKDKRVHIRDAGGLALSTVLPPTPGTRRKARGATPRKRTAGPPKPRGAPGPLDLAKRRAKSAGWAQRVARKAATRAAREAAGCKCKVRGRHRKDCSRGPASSAEAVLRRAAGVPPKVDAAKWAAYLDGTG